MKKADLEKKEKGLKAEIEREVTRLRLQNLLQECKQVEADACRLEEEQEREELLRTPRPLMIVEADSSPIGEKMASAM